MHFMHCSEEGACNMGSNLTSNFIEIVAVILFGIGFTDLFLHKNLIKKIIGLNIMDTADGIQSADKYINPVPSGLVLTGIVVSVSVTALMLALTICLYYRYHTLDLDKISLKVREKEE